MIVMRIDRMPAETTVQAILDDSVRAAAREAAVPDTVIVNDVSYALKAAVLRLHLDAAKEQYDKGLRYATALGKLEAERAEAARLLIDPYEIEQREEREKSTRLAVKRTNAVMKNIGDANVI